MQAQFIKFIYLLIHVTFPYDDDLLCYYAKHFRVETLFHWCELLPLSFWMFPFTCTEYSLFKMKTLVELPELPLETVGL